MAKLPTVKLKHRDGRTRIMNQAQYAGQLDDYVNSGWKIISMRGGDAGDDLVDFVARQEVKEIARARNPEHEAYNDEKRQYEGRAIPGDIVVDPKPEETMPDPPVDGDEDHVDDQEESSENIEDMGLEKALQMPWGQLRDYVERVTGTRPRSKVQAKVLLETKGE